MTMTPRRAAQLRWLVGMLLGFALGALCSWVVLGQWWSVGAALGLVLGSTCAVVYNVRQAQRTAAGKGSD